MKESPYLEDSEKLVELMKKVPAFTKLQDKLLRKLLRISKICSFSANEVITKEGTLKNKIYVLMSGNVTVSKDNQDILSLNNKGDVFGEMSLLEKGKRTATVTADVETTCLKIDTHFIENPDSNEEESFQTAMHKVLAKILASRLRELTIKYNEAEQEIEQLKKKFDLDNIATIEQRPSKAG